MFFCETDHIIARTLATLSHLQDLAYLGQRESQRLRLKHESKTFDVLRAVNAVTRLCPRWFGQQLLPLIEPNRLNRYPGLCRELADLHRFLQNQMLQAYCFFTISFPQQRGGWLPVQAGDAPLVTVSSQPKVGSGHL